MKGLLHHLFFPHERNNFRAKLLHHKSIFLAIFFLVFGGLFLSIIRTNYPSVLGVSSDISVDKLLILTNIERGKNGLGHLEMNDKLSEAASNKADDMFAKNYWAHNSPDGKTPWVFIRGAGYNYVYAGENLARGFETADEVVKAWMASLKHRENVLSENFREVGFAVKKGKLNGEETVLVVEQFGNQGERVPQIAYKKQEQNQEIVFNPQEILSNEALREAPKSFIKSISLASNLDRIILSIFILALVTDMIVVEGKRVVRFVGHNMDHILFLTLIILIIGVLGKGIII